MRRQKGFTLIEIIVVVAILVMLMVIALAAFRPGLMINRANDSKRKKDVVRIQTAFEEYANDDENGCYPTQAVIDVLMDPANCRKNVVQFPQLKPWICDPKGQPYKLAVPPGDCPRWYKIMAQLENRQDSDIPEGWYSVPGTFLGSSINVYTRDQVNYGKSSTNTSWEGLPDNTICETNCYKRGAGNSCTPVDLVGGETCSGSNCFRAYDCKAECQVSYCP